MTLTVLVICVLYLKYLLHIWILKFSFFMMFLFIFIHNLHDIISIFLANLPIIIDFISIHDFIWISWSKSLS
jgi:hypothetical protein